MSDLIIKFDYTLFVYIDLIIHRQLIHMHVKNHPYKRMLNMLKLTLID